jgi:phospholipase/carboxylesterase
VKPIDAFLHLRRRAESGQPTLLLLHGRGGSERDLVGVAHALGSGVGYLAPRGPEVQPPGWAWFTNRGIGIPVVENTQRHLDELSAWLDVALPHYGITGRVVAVGFSNGGMMAGALLAARPDVVSGAALFSSAYPLPGELRDRGGLAGRRMLITAGDADAMHPTTTFTAGVASYEQAGALVEARLEPGVGHEITLSQLDVLRIWLAAA